AEFSIDDPASRTHKLRPLDVQGRRGAHAEDDPGMAVRRDPFDDQGLADGGTISRPYRYAAPRPGKPRHGLWHLWARCDETHVRGQRGLALTLLGRDSLYVQG